MNNHEPINLLDVLYHNHKVSTQIRNILDKALQGRELTIDEMVALFDSSSAELNLILAVADELRRQQVGETVTYIVNRNINFTNVCIKRCGFCAFSRNYKGDEAYFLPIEEVVRKAQEAWDLGATEVCIQAGLAPQLDGDYYIRLLERIKSELPDLHVHGFSPEEVLYGSIRSNRSVRDYLRALKETGIGSLPGTSAEILVQSVRDKISRGPISAEQWEDVIRTAHSLGIPTTATIMYGHVETHLERAIHLDKIRAIQKETGGFTEFVPLSFVHTESPMWLDNKHDNIQPGPTGLDVIKMHAISRIVLGQFIPHIQASWVKEGLRFAQILLQAGVDDLGGTLINESISTSAGAGYGQLVRPVELRQIIWNSDRIAAERTTLYGLRRVFQPGEHVVDRLDQVTETAVKQFGSYHQLIHSSEFRYLQQRPLVSLANQENRSN